VGVIHCFTVRGPFSRSSRPARAAMSIAAAPDAEGESTAIVLQQGSAPVTNGRPRGQEPPGSGPQTSLSGAEAQLATAAYGLSRRHTSASLSWEERRTCCGPLTLGKAQMVASVSAAANRMKAGGILPWESVLDVKPEAARALGTLPKEGSSVRVQFVGSDWWGRGHPPDAGTEGGMRPRRVKLGSLPGARRTYQLMDGLKKSNPNTI